MRPLANLFNFKKSIFTESYKYFITTNITKGAELRKIDKKYEKWPTVFILIKKTLCLSTVSISGISHK